jgi:hypothetical protein
MVVGYLDISFLVGKDDRVSRFGAFMVKSLNYHIKLVQFKNCM